MNFGQLKQRVADETGLDLTTSASKVGEWVNQAYQHISGAFNWPWLLTSGAIQTEPDVTTYTATCVPASTTVTLSAAPSVSYATYYCIQFPLISDDWYRIDSHTAFTATLTLNVGFTGLAGVAGTTTNIRRVLYNLPVGADRIVSMRQTISDQEVIAIDPRDVDRILPDPTATGYPRYYQASDYNTTTNSYIVSFFPNPSIKQNILTRYYKKITELVADADTPLVPEKWQNSIAFTALALYGHPYIDDTRVSEAMSRAKAVIIDMEKYYSPSPTIINVMQPWDQRVSKRIGSIRFPTNFDQRWYY
jgi:hypothetical protein